eukprot:maker-scaffold48_size466083-snap-gene-2.9 protein:Tk05978 transcript:maker-scaffold48_size466083-snap-gene-2.9-mRNA-1 annotation:"hypothetical protein TRIADDRAFT_50060"
MAVKGKITRWGLKRPWMSEQEAKRQRVSDLLDAEVDPKRISEIVGVSERTVRNIRAAKKIGNGVERKEGSGGNGLKRNVAFLKSLEAKIKADPTASMRRLADEFDVDEITIKRAVHDDLDVAQAPPLPRMSFMGKLLFNHFQLFIPRDRTSGLSADEVPQLSEEYMSRHLASRWRQNEKFLSPKSSWFSNTTLRLILKLNQTNILLSGILEFLRIVFSIMVPLSLQRIIQYIDVADDEDQGFPIHGILYALLLVGIGFLGSLSETHAFFQLNMAGIKTKSALASAVIRKSLSIRSPKDSDVVNLISVDTVFLQKAIRFVHLPWACPLQLLLSILLLYSILGPSIFPGLAGLCLILLVSLFLSIRMKECQCNQLFRKDERLKKIVEVLNHLKVIKFQVWERTFEQSVQGLRDFELEALREFLLIQAFQSFLWNCAIFLVAFLSFASYAVMNYGSERLTATTAFVSLAIFNNMRNLFRLFPSGISSWSQGCVSIQRMDDFLSTREMPSIDMEAKKDERIGSSSHIHSRPHRFAIRALQCSFARSDLKGATKCLQNLNLTITKGELIGVIGQMGCGKSTLLEALSGELIKVEGQMEVSERALLVANAPWLRSGTIRDNILLGEEYAKFSYDRVVAACGLTKDLQMAPDGDLTWVHGNGDNLSGGQRQRINLARAVYRLCSTYLLDDPLSAVDPKLRKSIFKEVISSAGLLRKKTRVMIVNDLSMVEQMDKIILMQNGTIMDFGTLDDIRDRHSLDLEVWKSIKELKALETDDQGEADIKPKPKKFKRQDTMSILKSVQTREFDSLDDLGYESVSKANYIFYFRNLGFGGLALALVCYISCQVFEVCTKLWLAKWTAEGQEGSIEMETNFVTIYGSLGFCQALSYLAAVLQVNNRTIKASSRIHQSIFSKVVHSTIDFIWSTQVGAVANRFSRDLNEVDAILPSTLKSFIFQCMRICGTLFIVLFTIPTNIFSIIPLLLGIFWIFKFYIQMSRVFRRLASATMASLNGFASEHVSGVASIRTYCNQAQVIEMSLSEIDKHQKNCYMEMVSDGWLFVRLQIITSVFIGSLSVMSVLNRHSITSHMAGLCLTSAIMIMSDVFLFTRYAAALEKSMVSIERLQEYEEISQEPISVSNSFIPMSERHSKTKGHLTFHRLTGRYPGNGSICLMDVSVDIKPGEKIGIVGQTGAGKSSIALLLFRLIERLDGSILIDHCDIAKDDLAQHRSRITIIPQVIIDLSSKGSLTGTGKISPTLISEGIFSNSIDTYHFYTAFCSTVRLDYALFQGTLRYNLDPDSRYSDFHIWSTIRSSGMTSFIQQFPNGLDFSIDSDGIGLSVGERQLICTIRGLLSFPHVSELQFQITADNKIVVLDEATSALSRSIENKILQSVNDHFVNATILTITHRVHKVLKCDKILVMDSGRVAEFDSPSRLLNNRQSMLYRMLNNASKDGSLP